MPKSWKFILLVSLMLLSLVPFATAQNSDDYARILRGSDVEAKRDVLFRIFNEASEDSARVAIAALTDTSEIVRATAVKCIVFLPPTEASKLLFPLLADKAPFVRKETALAIGKLHELSGFERLSAAFSREKDSEVKTALVEAIGQSGNPAAYPILSAVLAKKPKDDQSFLRRSAARAIGRIAQQQQTSNPYVVTPESTLENKHDTITQFRFIDLSASSPTAAAAVATLTAVVNNPKETDDVRREALFAIGSIASPRSIELLRSAVSSKDPYFAEIGREALRKMGVD
jgi:HEAT repeat protein